MGRARGVQGDGDSGAGPAPPDEGVRDVPAQGRETNKRPRRATRAPSAQPKEDQTGHGEEAPDEDDEAKDEAENDHDETDDEVEIDEDDPVAVLTAQGVSESMAKSALERANGDLNAAVLIVVNQRVLEKEEKEMAKVMEDSLREAEEESAKRDTEEAKKKATSPVEFFKGSAFLDALGDVGTALLRDDCPAKAHVIETLEFESDCKKWYKNSQREVDEKFAAVAAEIVASVDVEAGDGVEASDPAGKKHKTDTLGAEGAERRGALGGGGEGGGGGGAVISLEKAHSMLVAHLMELKEAVLAMPAGQSGSVPDVFSPSKGRKPDEIDLTAE